jgi:ribosomal protein S18 acetylase RimI-like enzyme
LVDTLLTFDSSLERLKAGSVAVAGGQEVGFADPSDEGAVTDLAGVAFQLDRFNRDPKIAPEAACRMKRDWAANFFRGQRGRWMIVARDGGRVTGFLQLLHVNGDQMIVDLIAVAASHMGQGLGKAMFAFAARHCTDVATVLVGTQAANIPAARLYESLGFRLNRIQYVFHFHGD